MRMVYLFLCAILLVHQALNALAVLQLAENLVQSLVLSPTLLVLISMGWVGLAGMVLVMLMRHQTHAPRYAQGLLGGFVIYNALRWLLWTQADYERGRAALYMVVLVGMLLALMMTVGRWLWRRLSQREVNQNDGHRRTQNTR